jgi:hypothetical protein
MILIQAKVYFYRKGIMVVLMSLREIYIIMSWMIPEYKIAYYNTTNSYNILPEWERIRTISDLEYDRKENLYYEIAIYLGDTVMPEVGVDFSRSSRKIVMDKMSQHFSSKIVPLVWDNSFETLFIYELFANEILKSAKCRSYKVKTHSKTKIKKKYK